MKKVVYILIIIFIIMTSGCTDIFGASPTPTAAISSLNISQKPSSAIVMLNSILLNDTIPINMAPNQKYVVTITMQNNGEISWSYKNNTVIAAVPDDIKDTVLFGNSTFSMKKDTIIRKGEKYVWNFQITAPKERGNYTLKYQLLVNNDTWFGDCLIKNVTVGKPGDDVLFSSIDIPQYMKVNSKINITIIVQNMGRYPWPEKEFYQLAIDYQPNDASQFIKTTRIHMNPDSVVMPGQTCKWKFLITAPSYETTYNVTFRMVHNQEYIGNPITKTVKIIK